MKTYLYLFLIALSFTLAIVSLYHNELFVACAFLFYALVPSFLLNTKQTKYDYISKI